MQGNREKCISSNGSLSVFYKMTEDDDDHDATTRHWWVGFATNHSGI